MDIYDSYEYQGRNVWDGPNGIVTKHNGRFLTSPIHSFHPIYVDPQNNPAWYDTFEAAVVAIEFADAEELTEEEDLINRIAELPDRQPVDPTNLDEIFGDDS